MPTSDRESQSPSQYSDATYDSYSDESFYSDEEESRKGRSAKSKRATPRASTTQGKSSRLIWPGWIKALVEIVVAIHVESTYQGLVTPYGDLGQHWYM